MPNGPASTVAHTALPMSSLTRLQDALLQLEDHLCKAGTALITAERDSEAADIERMLHAFGWRYKAQKDFLRDYGEAVQELDG